MISAMSNMRAILAKYGVARVCMLIHAKQAESMDNELAAMPRNLTCQKRLRPRGD